MSYKPEKRELISAARWHYTEKYAPGLDESTHLKLSCRHFFWCCSDVFQYRILNSCLVWCLLCGRRNVTESTEQVLRITSRSCLAFSDRQRRGWIRSHWPESFRKRRALLSQRSRSPFRPCNLMTNYMSIVMSLVTNIAAPLALCDFVW